MKTPELLCHAVPEFCQLTKELGGALTSDQIYADDGTPKPWKARQNSSYSAIVKWISPTRFVVSEESQWQVKERDPSATLGQYRGGGEIRGRERRRWPLFIMFGSTLKVNASFYLTTKLES